MSSRNTALLHIGTGNTLELYGVSRAVINDLSALGIKFVVADDTAIDASAPGIKTGLTMADLAMLIARILKALSPHNVTLLGDFARIDRSKLPNV